MPLKTELMTASVGAGSAYATDIVVVHKFFITAPPKLPPPQQNVSGKLCNGVPLGSAVFMNTEFALVVLRGNLRNNKWRGWYATQAEKYEYSSDSTPAPNAEGSWIGTVIVH
jgi:hypothetical protein